jgi:2-keto-4-pentenoate hydratase/2-oxohepta-3-ene-1,7-dioic acid hydratase in catechol pathway
VKLVTYRTDGNSRAGLWLKDDRILDIAQAVGSSIEAGSVLALIAGGESAVAALRRLDADPPAAAIVPAGTARLLAPIPRPAKNVFCIGRNYVDHIKEGARALGNDLKLPEVPQIFTKPPTAVIGPDADVRLDPKVTKRLDYEVELGVVIGKGGRDIPRERAFEHIFGYTIINDVTARDLQRRHEQWFKGKGLDTSCPMGPWIVDKDELGDPTRLQLSLTVNGEERQRARVSQMIFDIPTLISALSAGLTLEPGDVIATGTPSGVGFAMDPPQYLKDGDLMVCTIEAIGSLSNRIVEV